MKRRDFVSRVLIAGSALSLGMGCKRKIEPVSVDTAKVPVVINQVKGKTINEPEKQIPILAETDVLVIGGGPSGTAAAIAASRTGAETYLVERYNNLGGLSFERELVEDARIIGTCLVTGHGAGAAAGLAVKARDEASESASISFICGLCTKNGNFLNLKNDDRCPGQNIGKIFIIPTIV